MPSENPTNQARGVLLPNYDMQYDPPVEKLSRH
jgi:hypothetical protein